MLEEVLQTISGLKIMGLSLLDIVSIFSQGAMLLGGVFPFIPQYLDIHRTSNTEGFSLFVCLNLLIAHILRIMFWFGERFELPLLGQSILMTFSMLVLVELCVRVNSKHELVSARPRRFTGGPENVGSSHFQSHSFLDFDIKYFWKWTDFLSYVEFTVTFSLVIGVITYLLLDISVFVQFLGFMAVFMEAMLGMPQFYRNYVNKCTVGMSRKMVAMWTCGDIFKTVYFIARSSPVQFWICGLLQIGIDISIFAQVGLYRGNAVPITKPAIS
ncbi:solute carrier family 66 member 2-like isoform X1 [Littorina saxatilis]|uniref:Solute carrier family 66 member 2 n=1 Tax=Littorina saxatilis TaxID=31220 RepID=A0AAN9GMP7_9CAEN